ncbi:MAG: L,D-transpeptidase family protein [Patescibacteria group bacterium]
MHRLRKTLLCTSSVITALSLTTPVFAAPSDPPFKPEETRPGVVSLWSGGFSAKTTFSALPASAKGGGTLASGDLDGDGQPEILVGAGPGVEPYVNVFDGSGKKLGAFLAYEKTFRGGVRIAVADTDGDGRGEAVTVPGPGREATLKTFSMDGKLITETLAYPRSFQGGAHVAAIDLANDGRSEIATSPGPTGGPHVRIWNGDLTNLGRDFFAFDASMRDGVTIASVRTPMGPQLVVAPESWSAPVIRRYSLGLSAYLEKEFDAFDPTSKNGATLGAADLDGDGTDEIVAAQNGQTSAEVRVFGLDGMRRGAYLVVDPLYRGGVSFSGYGVGKRLLMTMPIAPVVRGPLDIDKKIDINLKQQRLIAFEHGRVADSFLVSTGVGRHPTPVAKTEVLKKIPIMDYRWSYGPGNPDNYDIKNVKYNLNILPHIYIHTAYWHNNFGHVMSHGCVNTSLQDAERIYNWATTGTAVELHY